MINVAEAGNLLTVVASLTGSGCLISWLIKTELPGRYRRVVIALILLFIANAIEGAFWSMAYHFAPDGSAYHKGFLPFKDVISISTGLIYCYATIEFINLAYSRKPYQKWLLLFVMVSVSVILATIPPPRIDNF